MGKRLIYGAHMARSLAPLLVLLALLLSGCITDDGKCRTYQPLLCLEGEVTCEIDKQGCRVCSCRDTWKGPRPSPGGQER